MLEMAELQFGSRPPRFGVYLLGYEADILERLLTYEQKRTGDEEHRSLCLRLLEKVQPYSLLALDDEELMLLKKLLWKLRAGLRFLLLEDDSRERRRYWRWIHGVCEGLLEQIRWAQRYIRYLPLFDYEQLSLGEFIPGIPKPRPRRTWRRRSRLPRKPMKPRKLTEEALELMEKLSEAMAAALLGVNPEELRKAEREAMRFGLRKEEEP